MKTIWIVPVLAGFICQPIFASADSCRGALSALNRVKEQLSPDTPQNRLRIMFATLKDASHACPDEPEILYFRSLVAERVGDKRDAEYVKGKLADASYKPAYNPFTPPPAAATIAEAPPSNVGHKWALVVGVNQFKDPSIPGLRFAVNDSTSFAKYLTDPKGGRFQRDRVKTLSNEEATLVGFRAGLGWLRANAQPNDLVVIYISSHGSPRDSDPNGVSYIIMNDTDPSDPAKLYATSVQMIDLVEQINREIKARRVVLFLDTCYSGDASAAGRQADGSRRFAPVWTQGQAPATEETAATSAFSAALNNLKIGEGRAVITASRANEESWENASLKHGYFTYYLINALMENGGTQTLGDVFPKVRQEVSSTVSKEHVGKTQTPSCEFSQRAATIVVSIPESSL